MEGVDLAGLKIALALHSPKQMTDGGRKISFITEFKYEA